MRVGSKTLNGLLAAGLAMCLSIGAPASAQDSVKTLPVYTEGLQSGWQSWSWAKVALDYNTGDVKAIEVEGDPWSGLFLHHDPFMTTGYSKLVFYINGGVDGGQTVFIKAFSEGKAIDSNFQIVLKAKTWNKVEVPLADIGAKDRSIEGIVFQGGAQAYKPYFVTKIGFE